jgi:hydroxymethylglutaryl-CoA lyase
VLVFFENYLLMALELIECPRDAMQGIHQFIPTQTKINYLNLLLRAGFHSLDFGSFVSPKAIPQLADTPEVIEKLESNSGQTKLLAIVANLRGAQTACSYAQIQYIGFPFSISETFQQRNTNSSVQDSLKTVEAMQQLCVAHGKTLVVYLSMGFGNPYGDPYSSDLLIEWSNKMAALGVSILSLSDTIGIANPNTIKDVFSALIPALPQITFGAHLHTTPDTWEEKMAAAWEAGCQRFDGAIKGFGGCPMATDALTGNMPMENILHFLDKNKVAHGIDSTVFDQAMLMANEVFPVETSHS